MCEAEGHPRPERHRPLSDCGPARWIERVPAGARTPLEVAWPALVAGRGQRRRRSLHQLVLVQRRPDSPSTATGSTSTSTGSAPRSGASGRDLYGTMPPTRVGALAAVHLPADRRGVPGAADARAVRGGHGRASPLLSIVRARRRAGGVPARARRCPDASSAGRSRWSCRWRCSSSRCRPTSASARSTSLLMLLVTLDCLLPAHPLAARPARRRRGGHQADARGVRALLPRAPRLPLGPQRRCCRSWPPRPSGFVLAWHSSVEYWTGTVFDSSRIGGVGYVGNQSVQSVLARAGLHGATATWALDRAVDRRGGAGGAGDDPGVRRGPARAGAGAQRLRRAARSHRSRGPTTGCGSPRRCSASSPWRGGRGSVCRSPIAAGGTGAVLRRPAVEAAPGRRP